MFIVLNNEDNEAHDAKRTHGMNQVLQIGARDREVL